MGNETEESTHMIRITDVTEENWLEVAGLSVKEEQKAFLAPAIGILARGYVYRNCNARVWVIENDGTAVGAALPEGLDILHHSVTGRLHTLIIRGGTELARARLASVSPLFMDTVPLTLEEIFIYEMGGADYAVKELLL